MTRPTPAASASSAHVTDPLEPEPVAGKPPVTRTVVLGPGADVVGVVIGETGGAGCTWSCTTPVTGAASTSALDRCDGWPSLTSYENWSAPAYPAAGV